MITRRIRQDLDLILVASEKDQALARGRVVQFEDGRWRLVVPVGNGEVELRGDRWTESRPVTLLLLRLAAEAA